MRGVRSRWRLMRLRRLVKAVSASVLCAAAFAMPASGAACTGDCDGDGDVVVSELVAAVNIALGAATIGICPGIDASGDGRATVDELVVAVGAALEGCPQPAATVVMAPGTAGGFFSMPWPNDTRKHADGTIDLEGLPGTEGGSILAQIVAAGTRVTTAFGTNAAVFFRTTVLLDTATLPDPEGSLAADSTVMLVNLDDPGAPRVPLLTDFRTVPSVLRPGRLLALLPYPGHPLTGDARYAAVLFAGLHAVGGQAFEPADLLAALDLPWDASRPVDAATWDTLREQRDAVFAYVDSHTTWTRDDVVGFTVFTTQDTTANMRAVAAAIDALPAPAPVHRELGDCALSGGSRATVGGELDLPKWQAGEFPFAAVGGGIEVADGKAVQQSVERVVFEMTFPCGPAPRGGWPILLFMDGTGASANSHSNSELGSGTLPYVVASIAPLYSGDRDPQMPPPFNDTEFLFFNYFNPLAARTNQIQQAADMIYLRRIVEGVVLSADETGSDGPVETNDDLVVIGGHSQGALTVPHVLAVDPHFGAGFISAGGAGLYHTILHRGDVRPLIGGFLGIDPAAVDMFHPLLHVVQTVAEEGDAANYAPLVNTAHVLAVGGLLDGCSPLEVVSHLSTALGLEVANPLALPLFGSAALESSPTTLPVQGNLPGGRTAVLVELDTGHFGASTNPGIGRSFIESLARGDVPPNVDPGPLRSDTTPGCAGRYDPLSLP